MKEYIVYLTEKWHRYTSRSKRVVVNADDIIEARSIAEQANPKHETSMIWPTWPQPK